MPIVREDFEVQTYGLAVVFSIPKKHGCSATFVGLIVDAIKTRIPSSFDFLKGVISTLLLGLIS